MLQDARKTKTQKITQQSTLTFFAPGCKGATMCYPYLDLQIKSHIHPKFVICNIGWQANLPSNVDRFTGFTRQYYQRGPDQEPETEVVSQDARWSSRLGRLLRCWEIYGKWKEINTCDDSVIEWKNNGEGASPSEIGDSMSGVSHTTAGRYHTRSSQPGPTPQGHLLEVTSTPIRQVASHPRMPARGKGRLQSHPRMPARGKGQMQ